MAIGDRTSKSMYGLILAAVLAAAQPVPAFAEEPHQFEITTTEAARAIQEFGMQAGVQIFASAEQLSGKNLHEVTGTLSTDAGLRVLLAGTGLAHRYVGERTVALVEGDEGAASKAPDSSTNGNPTTDAARLSRYQLRLAHADQGNASGDSSVEKQEEQVSQRKSVQLEEVLVTGSRIPLSAKEQAQPVLVFTAEDIDRSGRVTVADFLNTLPQVSMNSVSGGFQAYAGQTGVHLHGLPLSATLTLIDGQSIELGYYGNLDLGVIPASAIERIEIIPVGSSAIYGSSALAGVVNIVTKKHFDGAEVDVKYGTAHDYSDNTVNAAFGKDWETASASVMVSHQHQGGLRVADRELPATGDFTRLGGKDYRYPYCNPGTVYGLNGANLPGLNASQAAIPAGLSGTPAIADFAATAGTQNKCNYYGQGDLSSPLDQSTLIANAHYAMTPAVDLFATLMYSHSRSDSATRPIVALSNRSYIVSADNPYNPFGQNVGVSWSYGAFDQERTVDFVRPAVGLRGDIGGGWHYEATALYSRDSFAVHQPNINASAVHQALASSDPTTALNVFTSGAPGPQALLDSLYTSQYERDRDSLLSGQAVLRGPLLTVPAGSVQSVFGAEYDRSTIWDQFVSGNGLLPASATSRNAYAVFTEERIPLMGNNRHPESGATLALSFAGRFDHSNDFGSKATYQGGLEWRPVDSWLFRGDFGTSYRAPPLAYLHGSTSTPSTTTVVDPYRGNTSYVAAYTAGPNANLRPETGRSTTFGAVYSSDAFKGLEASLTYWRIDYDNYIGYVNQQDVLTYPEAYPSGLLTRAAPTATDIANGWLGPVTAVYATYVNYGTINVRGFDSDIRYRVQSAWGVWTPALALTQTFKYQVALRPGQPQQSFVSQATTSPGWAPRWKGNLSLSWEKGPWSASVAGRYISSYGDYTAYGGSFPHELGDFWLFDANMRFDIGHALEANSRWLSGSYVAIGGTNVFNRQPQFSYFANLGYDPSQADILGRVVYVRAGLRF